MPSPPRPPSSGQAAAEYVALLCLVAVVTAGAGAVAGGFELHPALARTLHLALCSVGGDICRGSQARAAGLEPCVVKDERYTTRWSANGLIFKSSQEHGFAIEQRSDGRVVVTAGHDRQGGLGARFAASAGPASASAEAGVTAGWRSGMVWELEGTRELRRFLSRTRRPHRLERDADWRRAGLPEPTVRYLAGGAAAELSASVEAGLVVPIVTGEGRAALGRRVGPQGTTWFFDVPASSARLLGGSLPGIDLGRTGAWSAALEAGSDGRVDRLVLRTSVRGRRPDEEIELERAVDLHDAAAAAAARDLLRPASAVGAARALARMGTLQRDVYRSRELDSGIDLELAAGVVGLGHADRRVVRRLVASTVVGPDGRRTHRGDCLTAVWDAVGSPR